VQNSRKIRFIIFSFILAIITLSLIITPIKMVSANFSIVTITHQPTSVEQNSEVTIEITFNDDVNVSNIKIQYCSLQPEFACHIPKIDMIDQGSNVWLGTFIITEESGTIGYELYISLLNGTTIIAPDSIDYLGYDNIIEQSPDVFYFSIVLLEPTNSASLNVNLVEVAFVFSIIVLFRIFDLKRRRKMNV